MSCEFHAKPLSDESKRRIALVMSEIGCIKFGDYTLASGQKSPYYCNARLFQSFPEAEAIIADAFAESLSGIKVDRFCGVPDGAVSMTTLVATRLGIGRIGLSKQNKDHGTRSRISGYYEPGMKLCLLDDVITTGGSVVEAAEYLKLEGQLETSYCAINVDREQGGLPNLAAKGYAASAMITVSEAFAVYREEGLIAVDLYEQVRQYLEESRIKLQQETA